MSIGKVYNTPHWVDDTPRPHFITHGLISRGEAKPTLVWGHGYQSGSFLIWRHYRTSKIQTVRTVDRALLSRALQLDFLGSHVLYAYPRAYFDLLSRGEAIRDKPAQYISMGARVYGGTTVPPNGVRTVDRALFSRALQLDFLGSHVLCSVS